MREEKPYHHGNLREALLERAEIALEADGVHDLTLRELCRQLGVSHTSSRRHFSDKRALLDALAERGFHRFASAIREAVTDAGVGFESRLRRLVQAHVRFASAHPALYGWMFEAKYRPGAPDGLKSANEEAFSSALAVYADGRSEGEIVQGDLRGLALVAFSAVHGLIALSDGGTVWGMPLEPLALEVTAQILDGLRPR